MPAHLGDVPGEPPLRKRAIIEDGQCVAQRMALLLTVLATLFAAIVGAVVVGSMIWAAYTLMVVPGST